MFALKNKFEKLIRHPFSRDVALLQASGVVTTGLGFLTSLLFARMLGPEQFGFYALVFALAGFINIFQEVGIGQGTINLFARSYGRQQVRDSQEVLSSFIRISVWVALTAGLLGVLAAPLAGRIVYDDLELGKLAGIAVATFALTLFFPLTTIMLQVARRIKQLAVLEVMNKLVYSGLPLLFLLFGLGVFGIVTGQLLAMIVMSVVGLLVYRHISGDDLYIPGLSEVIRTRLSREKLRRIFRFGLAIAINKNLLKIVSSVPLLLLGFFLATNSGLGFYKVAFAYMSLPVVFLGPVSRLLNIQFPRTEALGLKRLLRRFFQVSGVSLLIALAMTLALLLLGPFLIDVFYGPDYGLSKRLIYPLALYPVFVSAGVGLGPLFRTLDKMRVAIVINAASVLLMLPAAYLLIGSMAIRGLIITVLIFSLFPTVVSFIYFTRMYLRLKHARAGI